MNSVCVPADVNIPKLTDQAPLVKRSRALTQTEDGFFLLQLESHTWSWGGTAGCAGVGGEEDQTEVVFQFPIAFRQTDRPLTAGRFNPDPLRRFDDSPANGRPGRLGDRPRGQL